MGDTTITERLAVPDLHVCAFLRLAGASESRARRLLECVREYCVAHEYRLGAVITEGEEAPHVLSAAFTALLAQFEQQKNYAVVVPSFSHLGPVRILQERQRILAERRTRILAVRQPDSDRGSALSASEPPCGRAPKRKVAHGHD